MNKSSFQLFFLVQIGLKTCQTNFKYVYVLQYAQVYMFKYTVCSSACAELHNGIGIYGSFTKNIRLIFLMKNGVYRNIFQTQRYSIIGCLMKIRTLLILDVRKHFIKRPTSRRARVKHHQFIYYVVAISQTIKPH